MRTYDWNNIFRYYDVSSIAELIPVMNMKNFSKADLYRADLYRANLTGANLTGANLTEADLTRADLYRANLTGANLSDADLSDVNLRGANLSDADLTRADLTRADLSEADLRGANLTRADLTDANLNGTKGLIKIIDVEINNTYWKCINENFKNNNYQFKIGINKLKDGEIFATDERILCSYPGFHFASKSWCLEYYGKRKYLAKIKIPEKAMINEPWVTNGKASSDMIEIIQVFDLWNNNKDVTEELKEKYGVGK